MKQPFARNIIPGEENAPRQDAGEIVLDPASATPDQMKAFLEAVTEEIRKRDQRIADLESSAASQPVGSGMRVSEQVGTEVSAILRAAEHAAETMRTKATEEAESIKSQASAEARALNERVAAVAQKIRDAQASMGALAADLVTDGGQRGSPEQPKSVLHDAGLSMGSFEGTEGGDKNGLPG